MNKISNFALIGSSISYSLSPFIYNYWFNKYSINANYKILDINKKEFNLNFITDLCNNYNGFNVTKPFKEDIIPIIKSLSKEVNYIKSVNLVVNNTGYNTDYMGLLDSYKYYSINLVKKNILVLGAGGAARALLYSLNNFDCTIYIYNRTEEKINKIINDYKYLSISKYKNGINFDIIFNTTSISFDEILKNVNIKNDNDILYYDLNYYHKNSYKNHFIDGLYMLLSQARYNFEKFFNVLPVVDEQLIEYIKNNK